MEMNYIQKGSNNPKMNENNIPDISTSYIEVPISFILQQKEKIEIEGGMQAAFLLTAHDNDLYGKVPNNHSIPFHEIDIGSFIGINYKFLEKMTLNSRLSNSIIPIREHSAGNTFYFNKG